MPPPLPGMDPWIESQNWADFHATALPVIREMLVPQLRPRYVAQLERRIYLDRADDQAPPTTHARVADVSVADSPGATPWPADPTGASAGAATLTPARCEIPMPVEHRESLLEIRDAQSREVVTVLELLSPANKRAGSVGRQAYLAKRDDLMRTRASLVEIDLLRGGQRLPLVGAPAPPGDYFVIVSKGWRRPEAEVYSWSVTHRLPTIPIPLEPHVAEPSLDLQAMFQAVYEQAGYDYALDYNAPVIPPLKASQQGRVG